jgi:hypothetical protein
VRPRKSLSGMCDGEMRLGEGVFGSRRGEQNRFLEEFWSERRGIGLFLVLLQRRHCLYGDIRVKDIVKCTLYINTSNADRM